MELSKIATIQAKVAIDLGWTFVLANPIIWAVGSTKLYPPPVSSRLSECLFQPSLLVGFHFSLFLLSPES
jgi:hypothetical protein